MGILKFMLGVLSSKLSEKVVSSTFKSLASRSLRKSIKAMIVDLCLDEMENAIEETGGDQEEVKKMRKKRKRKIASEVDVRLSALFKAFGK